MLLAVLLAYATARAEPRELDRPLVLAPGQLGATLGSKLVRTSTTAIGSTVHSTDADVTLLVGYGLRQFVAAGASYSIPVVNRLGSRGTVAVFGTVSFVDCGRWQVAMSLRGSLDLDSDHRRDLELGLAARYRLRHDVSLVTGTPWSPGPLGNQLRIEANDRSAFRLPLGLQMQFGERVAVDLTTSLARLALPSGSSATVFEETPITAGAWITLPYKLSVRLVIGTTDLGVRDDVEANLLIRYQ